jgi:hypothetical protein
VFVVIVDVITGTAYWQSIQKWARTVGQDWRNNKSVVTIHVPLANQLRDNAQFLASIQEADALIREKYAASLAQRVRHLEELDARFKYELRFADGITTHILHAKQAVPFQLQTLGERATEELTSAIERGDPATFEPGELSFGGGGIFDEMSRIAERSQITLEPRNSIPCEFSLASIDTVGRETTLVYGIRGQLVGGRVQRRILAQLEYGLMTISGALRVLPDKGIAVNYSLSFDMASWTGQPIMALPYFDRVRKVFREGKSAARLMLSFEILGQSLRSEIPERSWRPTIESLEPRIAFIDAARSAARYLGVNPNLPNLDEIDPGEVEDVLLLSKLVEQERVEVPVKGVSGTMSLDRPQVDSIPHQWLFENRLMSRHEVPAVLFGAASEHYRMFYEHQNLTFTDESLATLKRSLDSDTFPIRLSLASSPQSRAVISLVKCGPETSEPTTPTDVP